MRPARRPWQYSEHPHVRGEDPDLTPRPISRCGAPPRAWGGQHVHSSAPPGMGAPPRAWGGRLQQRRRDHLPRSTPTCVGEDGTRCSPRAVTSGAPPRAWGGHAGGSAAHRARRSTPTCVGRTSAVGVRSTRTPEHPHVRGEDRGERRRERHDPGAPPRAWGGPRLVVHGLRAHRSTPTCVGRTTPRASPAPQRTEHPHVRGEDRTQRMILTGGIGAPPRAWGGPSQPPHARTGPRSTPTCVGRTLPGG